MENNRVDRFGYFLKDKDRNKIANNATIFIVKANWKNL